MRMRKTFRRLTDTDFLAALCYWGLRRIIFIQVHRVFSIRLSPAPPLSSGKPVPGFSMHVLRHLDDLASLAPGVEDQLNEQTGNSCRSLLAQGDWIYFTADGRHVACQLNIRRGNVRVDSPVDLQFDFEHCDAFLNYLHTREKYRGRSLAGRLISFACEDLARKGVRRCFSHIRGSNFSSISAFRRAGWVPCAYILTSTSKRLLGVPGCARAGMRVERVSSA